MRVNDRHIWAERYDRTLADSIGVQGELATQIAAALRARLAPEEKAALETKPTDNPVRVRALSKGLALLEIPGRIISQQRNHSSRPLPLTPNLRWRTVRLFHSEHLARRKRC